MLLSRVLSLEREKVAQGKEFVLHTYLQELGRELRALAPPPIHRNSKLRRRAAVTLRYLVRRRGAISMMVSLNMQVPTAIYTHENTREG